MLSTSSVDDKACPVEVMFFETCLNVLHPFFFLFELIHRDSAFDVIKAVKGVPDSLLTRILDSKGTCKWHQ
ncbi:hypothetical protein QUF51_12645 [Bacillus pumilus]|nr:hypothetical protein [Bacillus pumilus]